MKLVVSENDLRWMHRYLVNKGLISEETSIFRTPEEIDQALHALGDSRESERHIQTMWNAFSQHKRRCKLKQKKGISSCSFELNEDSKIKLKRLTECYEQSQNRLIEMLIEKEYKRLSKVQDKKTESSSTYKSEPLEETTHLGRALRANRSLRRTDSLI